MLSSHRSVFIKIKLPTDKETSELIWNKQIQVETKAQLRTVLRLTTFKIQICKHKQSWPQFNLELVLPCRVRLKSSVPVSAARNVWPPRGAACTRVRCVTMVTYGTTQAVNSVPAAGVRSSARGQSVLALTVHRWAFIRMKLLWVRNKNFQSSVAQRTH